MECNALHFLLFLNTLHLVNEPSFHLLLMQPSLVKLIADVLDRVKLVVLVFQVLTGGRTLVVFVCQVVVNQRVWG